jgi:hypothetical protein
MAREDARADDRARLSVVRQAQQQVARATLAWLRGDRLAIQTHLQNAQRELLSLELDLAGSVPREGG